MTRLAKLVLFLSSFSPLLLLLAVRYWDRGCPAVWLALASVVAAGLGIGLLRLARGGQVDVFVIDQVEGRSESLTGYLVGYLFPFLVLDPDDILTVAATLLFVALLAWIYVEGNLVYLNPLLASQGRQIFQAEVHRLDDATDRRTLLVVANANLLRVNQQIETRLIAGDVRLADVVDANG